MIVIYRPGHNSCLTEHDTSYLSRDIKNVLQFLIGLHKINAQFCVLALIGASSIKKLDIQLMRNRDLHRENVENILAICLCKQSFSGSCPIYLKLEVLLIKNLLKFPAQILCYGEKCNGMSFHAPIPIAWLADEDSLMCFIVMMGRQIAKMFYTFSL